MKTLIGFCVPLMMLGAMDLVKEVRHELVMLPYYGVFDNLTYRVEGSKVTLFGSVTQPKLKTDATNAVKKIEEYDGSRQRDRSSSPLAERR